MTTEAALRAEIRRLETENNDLKTDKTALEHHNSDLATENARAESRRRDTRFNTALVTGLVTLVFGITGGALLPAGVGEYIKDTAAGLVNSDDDKPNEEAAPAAPRTPDPGKLDF